MIVLNALPTLGGTYVWQRAFRNHPAQEGVRLSVGGLPNARDAALRYLAAHLADLGETWFTLVDGPLGPWRLDLSQLAKRFSLSDQLWLSGQRLVAPDFESAADGKARVHLTIPQRALEAPLPAPPPSPATDRQLMEWAVGLARLCPPDPGKNSPLVGAVVARDGVPLGAAFRGELAPGDHAEYTLLHKKLPAPSHVLAGATLFTTLEPCTSRNPPKRPCVEWIVERRIAKVFVGMVDPNDNIRGLGHRGLTEKNIAVQYFDHDLVQQLEELNREFVREQKNRGAAVTAQQQPLPVNGLELQVAPFEELDWAALVEVHVGDLPNDHPASEVFANLRFTVLNNDVAPTHLDRVWIEAAGTRPYSVTTSLLKGERHIPGRSPRQFALEYRALYDHGQAPPGSPLELKVKALGFETLSASIAGPRVRQLSRSLPDPTTGD